MKGIRYTNKHYSPERIVAHGCAYNVIFGERSDGKTTSVLLEECLMKFKINRDHQFLLLRRFDAEIRENSMKMMLQENEYLRKKVNELFDDDIDFSHRKGGFYLVKTGELIGRVLSIQSGHLKKSVPMEKVMTILFDEFITSTYYIDDEVTYFFNILSSIIRHRTNVKVFLCGNTLRSIYTCPYFEAFGIDRRKLKQGYISVIKHQAGAKIAVEWCPTLVTEEKTTSSNIYFGLDNDPTGTIQMITQGSFETYCYTTQEVDGMFWNVKDRLLVPLYVTGLNSVFELSYKTGETGFPVFFVRKINTQEGKVKKEIEYNLALDDMTLRHNDGQIVPRFQSIVPMMGDGMCRLLDDFHQCQRCGRVLYDDVHHATEFNEIMREIRDR